MNKDMKNLWAFFKNDIFPPNSTKTIFNQYKDADKKYDLPRAPEIRQKNLLNYIKSFKIFTAKTDNCNWKKS